MEQVMTFEDDQCQKPIPGQTVDTMKQTAKWQTEFIALYIEKCHLINGNKFVMGICYESGVYKAHYYSDSNCNQEIPLSQLT